MKHLLLIDPLEKLGIKKDSSLMLGLSLKERGVEVYLLFDHDFYVTNQKSQFQYTVYEFQGHFVHNSFYIEDFILGMPKRVNLEKNDVVHMRLDPPFDTKYLRHLWMLQYLDHRGIKVLNAPAGILLHNEKLYAYENATSPIPSFIGSNFSELENFLAELDKDNIESLIFKPLDLFQGIGVEKIDFKGFGKNELKMKFLSKIKEFGGTLIVQPFLKQVYAGEVRSLFFRSQELGSILKTPSLGNFLANVAQGASYRPYQLTEKQKASCLKITENLERFGVFFVAFDILGDSISEVNITCPGLLVEVSNAFQTNLATKIIDSLLKN